MKICRLHQSLMMLLSESISPKLMCL